MATVDSLDIKIQSEAKSAEKALDSLIKKLGSVTSAMTKALNNKGLDGIGKSMEFASAKMDSLKKDMDGVAKSMSSAKKNINSAVKGIEEPIQNAKKSIQEVFGEMNKKFSDFTPVIDFTKTESELKKVSESYKNQMTKAQNDLNRLLASSGSEDKKINRMETYIQRIHEAKNGVKAINDYLEKISSKKVETAAVSGLDSIPEPKMSAGTAKSPISLYMDSLKSANEQMKAILEEMNQGRHVAPFENLVHGIENSLKELQKDYPEYKNIIEAFQRLRDTAEQAMSYPNLMTDKQYKAALGIEETASQLEKAEEKISDAGEKIKESLKEVSQNISDMKIPEVPTIEIPEIDVKGTEKFRDKIESVLEEVREMRELGEATGLWKTFQFGFASMAHGVMSSAEIIGEKVRDAGQKIRDFKSGLQDMRDAGKTIGPWKSALDALTPVNTFDAIKDKISSLKNAFAGLRKEKVFEEASSGAQEAEASIENVSQKVQKVSKAMGLASMSAEEFDSYLERLTVPDVLETDLGKLNTKLKAAQQALEDLKSKATNFQLLPGNGTDFNSEGFRKIQAEIAKTEKTIDLLTEKIGEISEESERAAAESAQIFRSNLANLQIPEIQTNSLEKLEKMLEKAEADLEKFKSKLENDITMGRITANFGDAGYQKAAEQIALTEKQIEAIKEKMKTADSSAGQTAGYSKLSKAMSSLSAMASGLGNTLSKVAAHIQSFAKTIGKLAASGLKSIGNGIKSLVSNLAKMPKALANMTKSVKGSDKSFKDNLKTILKYMFGIKALTSLIKKMASYMKDGMDNLVQYSSEVNHSVSLMTSGLLSLKNGLAVAFAPIVNVVAPYIDKLVDLLLSATNAVGRFFAAMTGKTVATQAKKVYQDYAESLNGVADAAKDAAKAIGTIGIDELNILSENKSDDAGAGIEDMFEDVTIEKDIADWAKRIRDAFLNQDWEELGKSIAELVNSGLGKIYDAITGITPKVEQALKNFAQVFNSFVEWLDWDLLGRTIAAGINLVTTSINALLGDGGIDFENLGRKISTGFRGMVDEIDWTGLGNAIGNWFMVSWRIADGFISDMWRVSADTMRNGWEELGIAVGEAVNGMFDRINFEQIARVLTEGFRGIIESAANALDTIRFDTIAEKINAGLDMLANGIAWEHIGEQITKFTAAISKAFNDLLGLDFGLVGTIIGNGITDIVRAFNQLTGEGGINFEQIGAQISDGLRNLFASIPWEEFGNALGNGFMLGWRILDGFITDMSRQNDAGLTGWAELGISIGNAVNGIFDKIDFGALGTLLSDGFNGLIDVIRNFIETVDWNSMAANLTQGLNNFIHGVDWAGAGATLSDLVMNLLNVFWEVAQNTDWESLGRGIGEFLSNIDWMGIIGKVFDIIWEVFSGFISGLFDTKSGKVVVGIAAGMAAIKMAFNGIEALAAAMEFVKKAKTIFELLPPGITEIAPKVVGKLKEIGTGINEKVVPLISTGISKIVGEGGLFSKLFTGASGLVSKIGPVLGSIGSVIFSPTGLLIAGIAAGVVLIIANWDKIKDAAGKLKDWIAEKFEAIKDVATNVLSAISDALRILWENLLKPIAEWIGNTLAKILETAFNAVTEAVSTMTDILSGIVAFLSGTIEGCTGILTNLIHTVGEILGNLGDIFSGVIDFITGVFTGDWEKAWDGVLSIFKGIFNMIPTIAEGVINHVIGLMNGIIGGINRVIDLIPGDLIPKIPDIKTVTLPRFATGGFPEDGLFLANHNELVGQFSNGQTAVANNAQIVDGIKYGVREAVAEVLAPYLADIVQNTRETADKDMSVRIGDRDIVSAYNRGSARQGYSFSS